MGGSKVIITSTRTKKQDLFPATRTIATITTHPPARGGIRSGLTRRPLCCGWSATPASQTKCTWCGSMNDKQGLLCDGGVGQAQGVSQEGGEKQRNQYCFDIMLVMSILYLYKC